MECSYRDHLEYLIQRSKKLTVVLGNNHLHTTYFDNVAIYPEGDDFFVELACVPEDELIEMQIKQANTTSEFVAIVKDDLGCVVLRNVYVVPEKKNKMLIGKMIGTIEENIPMVQHILSKYGYPFVEPRPRTKFENRIYSIIEEEE